jgi:hypothetical protein
MLCCILIVFCFCFQGLPISTRSYTRIMMLFLVLLMVACVANTHQTEPEHHVIPYKGKYDVKKVYFKISITAALGMNVLNCEKIPKPRNRYLDSFPSVHNIYLNCCQVSKMIHA